jgi:hypothetical protein
LLEILDLSCQRKKERSKQQKKRKRKKERSKQQKKEKEKKSGAKKEKKKKENKITKWQKQKQKRKQKQKQKQTRVHRIKMIGSEKTTGYSRSGSYSLLLVWSAS